MSGRCLNCCQWQPAEKPGEFRCPQCGVMTIRPTLRRVCGKAPEIPKRPPVPPEGVGTELKRILARFWIKSKPGCGCDRYAAIMNIRGIAWCVANVEWIIAKLAKEAKRRKIPFLRPAAALLLRWAIRNAKRNPACNP